MAFSQVLVGIGSRVYTNDNIVKVLKCSQNSFSICMTWTSTTEFLDAKYVACIVTSVLSMSANL